jgi:hypothetical protein
MPTWMVVVVLVISHTVVAGLALWWGKLHPSAAAKLIAEAGTIEKKIGG